jgi:excisionase family DNA binding protein
MDKLVEQFERFKDRVGDPLAAAVLTLTLTIANSQDKKTGLTKHDAAKYLGVSVSTIQAMSKDGRLRAMQIGRSVRFNLADLESLQRRQTTVEAAHPASDLRHFQRKKQPC